MILGNLFIAAAPVVHGVFQLIWFVLLVRIIFSWLNPNPRQGFLRSIVRAIYQITDPVMVKTRQLLPFLQVGGLDLSPIVLFMAVGFLDQFLTGTLYDIGYSMR